MKVRSDSGGALTPSDGGGAGATPSDAGGNTNTTDSPSPTAAPSDGGGQRVTVTADDFPPPDPAHYPGMNTETQQGAEATAVYFWNYYYWSAWSGDTSVLKELTADDCESCTELIQRAEKASDDYIFGTPSYIVVEGAITEQDAQGYDWVVTMRFREKASWKEREPDTHHLYAAVGMEWTENGWVIQDVTAEDVEDDPSSEGEE